MAIKTIIPLFRIGQVSVDILLVLAIYTSVFITRFEGNIPLNHIKQFWFFLPILPLIRITTNYIMGLYYHLWKYFGMKEMISVFYSTTLGSIIFVLVVYLTNNSSFPRSIFIFEWALMVIAFLLVRSSRRFSQEIINMQKKSKQRVLIIGAGIAGQHLATEMLRNPSNNYMPIGFIDDDKQKLKARINGLKVFGNRFAIPAVVKDWEIDMIIISIPSANPKIIKEIAEISSKTKAEVKIIPSIQEIISGDVKVSHIREVRIEDLLGRKPIIIDTSELSNLIKNKTVLVTGAGGSIGSELVSQLAKFLPDKIILLGHGENSIFKVSNKIKTEFPELDQVRVIADIKDKKMIDNIFNQYKPEIVFHAAAHKHVPLMEENLFEAILNNVYGTKTLVEVSSKYNVKKFVNISTDKAVNPTSVMGTTKRIAELVVQYYNSISKTEFITVRFGNVIGSRGSVIPIFHEQIKRGGPITITHPEMTRYFMTIPEAVQLVMQAGALGKGAEIFVLDMGDPIKITELALNMIKLSGYSENDIPIKYTGMREGEKLHESLFMESEKIDKTKHEKILVSFLDINYSNFINDLDSLFKYTSEFDTEKVNNIIINLVPDFKSKINYDLVKKEH